MQKCHLQLAWLTPSTQSYYRSPCSRLHFTAKHFSGKKEKAGFSANATCRLKKNTCKILENWTNGASFFFFFFSFFLPYLTTRNVIVQLHLSLDSNHFVRWKSELLSLHGSRYLLLKTSTLPVASGLWEGWNKTSISTFLWCFFCYLNCSWVPYLGEVQGFWSPTPCPQDA